MKSGTNVITVLDVKLSENKPTFGSVLPTFSQIHMKQVLIL